MIHHIVCFRFKPDTPPERVAAAGTALRGMRGRIPEIRDLSWGPNLAPGAAEYPWVLTVVMDDMAAVGRYLEHPHHQQVVAEYLAPFREARLALDIER